MKTVLKIAWCRPPLMFHFSHNSLGGCRVTGQRQGHVGTKIQLKQRLKSSSETDMPDLAGFPPQ